MSLKEKLKKYKIFCYHDNCYDELLGLIAIIIGSIGYIYQFIYSKQSMDLSSFSIIALFLFTISELLFFIQGIQKKSPTIALTRFITTIGFSLFIILWFLYQYKKEKKTKDIKKRGL